MLAQTFPCESKDDVQASLTKMNHLAINDLNFQGSHQSFTKSYIVQLMHTMNLNSNSVFYDLGSGFGMPVFTASLLFGVRQAIGIERAEYAVSFCNKVKDRITPLEKQTHIQFQNRDILDIGSIPRNVTHIWCFDTVFTRQVKDHILSLLENHHGWKSVVTSTKPDVMNEIFGDIFEKSEAVSGRMTSNGGSCTVRVYTKRMSPARKASPPPPPSPQFPRAPPRKAIPLAAPPSPQFPSPPSPQFPPAPAPRKEAPAPAPAPRKEAPAPAPAPRKEAPAPAPAPVKCRRCTHVRNGKRCKRKSSCRKNCNYVCWQHFAGNYSKENGCA